MRLADVLDVLKALEREGVRYAVFGGVAMAAHGLDRGTRDLDVFFSAEPENVLRLQRALQSVYHDPAIDDSTLTTWPGTIRPSNTARLAWISRSTSSRDSVRPSRSPISRYSAPVWAMWSLP